MTSAFFWYLSWDRRVLVAPDIVVTDTHTHTHYDYYNLAPAWARLITPQLPLLLLPSQAYQQFQDVKYTTPFSDDYGVEDDLQPGDEPYQLSFTRLMDIGGGTAPATDSTVEEGQSQALAQFEAACSDRIQPFDDSESDDEVRGGRGG